jgi:hypothetical protein
MGFAYRQITGIVWAVALLLTAAPAPADTAAADTTPGTSAATASGSDQAAPAAQPPPKTPAPSPATSAGLDVATFTNSDTFLHMRSPEQFNALKIFRNKIIYHWQELNSATQAAADQLTGLEESRRQLANANFDFGMVPKSQVQSDLDRAQRAVDDTQKQLNDPNLTPQQRGILEQQLAENTDKLKNVQQYLDEYDDKKKQMEEDRQKKQQQMADIDRKTIEQKDIIERSNLDLTATSRELQDVDEKIASLLIQTDTSNEFKKIMSMVFAGLVAIVIVGFFIIAFRDDGVRKSIFSNESGIQFITLFSLVIAIILFGIVGILEGKELAALLGGLSGYILGRGTPKRQE